jgi:hypothetical protein
MAISCASTAARNPRLVPIRRDKPVYATTSPSAREKALTSWTVVGLECPRVGETEAGDHLGLYKILKNICANAARNVVWYFGLRTKLRSLLRCKLEVNLKSLREINGFIKLWRFLAAESVGTRQQEHRNSTKTRSTAWQRMRPTLPPQL